MRLLRFSVFFAASCALYVLPLTARDVTLLVADTDLDIPLEGARIVTSDGGELFADEEGKVVVTVSDDVETVLAVHYPGYESGRLVVGKEGDAFAVKLRLGNTALEGRELVIEADKTDTPEVKSGRGVAISGDALTRTSEIGLIEDVMTAVKLLPGVGFSGMFSAEPSIRGGDPGDLTAVMDGFYIEDPYHWGGIYSIFAPQMVERARLSHGIFSARHGHTISGLLEITSRKPSPAKFEYTFGVSTSETNVNLSFPLGKKGSGGIMAMGKVTYWDLYLLLLKAIATGVPQLDIVNAITTAPYIRDASVTGYYRFSPELEVAATVFYGGDGVGAEYHNIFEEMDLRGTTRKNWIADLNFDWLNYRIFFTGGVTWNPKTDMVFRGTAGVGYFETKMLADFDISFDRIPADPNPDARQEIIVNNTLRNSTLTTQLRADYDWAFHKDFLFATGVQELYSLWGKDEEYHYQYPDISLPGFITNLSDYTVNAKNNGFSTSAYVLLEYKNPYFPLDGEFGLRLDHFAFVGKNFNVQTLPVINPRLNLDYLLIKDKWGMDSLSLTAGTGLFSSINDIIPLIDKDSAPPDYELRPNRSWTNLLGAEVIFSKGYSINFEAYHKEIFDRTYVIVTEYPDQTTERNYYFNGVGRVLGFDIMLQKAEGRYLEGWLSYSFTWAKYKDPNSTRWRGDWYYPDFQRYNYLNLVLTIKPTEKFHMNLRFGFASGKPEDTEDKESKQRTERTGFSWPIDIKFSWYPASRRGKIKTEIYLGIENLQSIFYLAERAAQSEGYTGTEDSSEYKPVYEMPVPMVSFGFKWTGL